MFLVSFHSKRRFRPPRSLGPFVSALPASRHARHNMTSEVYAVEWRSHPAASSFQLPCWFLHHWCFGRAAAVSSLWWSGGGGEGGGIACVRLCPWNERGLVTEKSGKEGRGLHYINVMDQKLDGVLMVISILLNINLEYSPNLTVSWTLGKTSQTLPNKHDAMSGKHNGRQGTREPSHE